MKISLRDWGKVVQNGVIIAFVLFQLTEAVVALGSYTQNENTGTFTIQFDNQQGLLPDGLPWREAIDFDPIFQRATLVNGFPEGRFTTVDIQPNSFNGWNKIILNENASNPLTDIKIDLYECDDITPTTIPGFTDMTSPNGTFDISAVPSSYTCIRVMVKLFAGTTNPFINSMQVKWNPLPGYLVSMSVPNSIPAGATLSGTINYSVSYVDDLNTVVWMTLPTYATSTVTNFTSSYGQNPALTFASASNGGTYAPSGIVINGITIPANSIFWSLGNIAAGQSGTVSFALNTQNGWENGMALNMTAHIDSLRGVQKNSDADPFTSGDQTFDTSITSVPAPTIDKRVAGVAVVGSKNYVINSGSFTPLITYSVKMTNTFSGVGRETIFNPTISDDVSDIANKLHNQCSIGTSALDAANQRITPITPGVTLPLTTTTLTWPAGTLPHIAPGANDTVSYTVDYTDCPEDGVTPFNNTASGSGVNTSTVSDSESIIVGIDSSPKGLFAKGDKVNGNVEIQANKDDNPGAVQTYGQSFAYELLMNNAGAVVLGDNVITDRIPDGLTFVSAALPPAALGTMYYNTSPSPIEPAYTVNAGTGITGAGWTSTVPGTPSTVKWVAMYVPCLNSALFPAGPTLPLCSGKPSSATGEIQVSIDVPTLSSDLCLDNEIENKGTYTIYRASSSYLNKVMGPITAVVSEDTEQTHVQPSLASFSQSSTISGAPLVQVGQNVTYTLTISNTGLDTSSSTVVTINTPQININGVPGYLSFVQATGGTVNTAGLPGTVTITLGSMPVGSSKTLTVRYNVPSGIKNNDNYTVNATVTGTDDHNCRTISSSLSTSSSVTSRPRLQTFKNAEESVVAGGDDIHYDITFRSTGNAPTTETYLIDHIPAHAVFKEAYTSGMNSNLVAFSCAGCQVYFSNNISLPSSLSASTPLSGVMINSYFTLGTQVSPGLWQPVGMLPEQVQWVAWKLDDSTMASPLLPSGATGKVGLTVTNDDNLTNNTPLTIDPSPIGTIISNAPGIFSSDLLQAIDNQVFTTILPNPGLRISKQSYIKDSDIPPAAGTVQDFIYAGEAFDWRVDYYNDSGNSDTNVVLTDTIPADMTVLGVMHTWNAKAIANGAVPGIETALTSPADYTISSNPDGTQTLTIDITDLRGGDLQNIEGGSLRLKMKSAATLVSTDTRTNFVLGQFSNPSGSYSVNTSDLVTIANPDLFIRKQVDITDPLANENITYTLTVSNETDHDAPNVLISDTLPAGLCYVGPMQVLTSGWSIGAPVITGGPCASAPTTLTWSVPNANNISNPAFTPSGTMPAHSGDIFIRYTVHVDASVLPGTTLLNGAHIGTDIPEDCYTNTVPVCPFINDTGQAVETPLPDPYVVKTAQLTVLPGQNATYTISYGNNTREDASGVYIVDTFPISTYNSGGYATNTDPDMKFISAVASQSGATIYYNTAPLSVTPPPYPDVSWTTTVPSLPTYIAVVPPGAILDGQSGPFQVTLTFQATDPNTSTDLIAGLTLTNKAEIFSTTVDSDTTNNVSTAATHTPGLDLVVTKKGSHEGGFPGIAPGDGVTYDITISNQGTVDACAVVVTDTLSTNMDYVAPTEDFTTTGLALTDITGTVSIKPHNLSGNPINTPIGITGSLLSTGVYEWKLGSASTTSYNSVCMPPGSYQTFHVYAKVLDTTDDSTIAANLVKIDQESGVTEDIISNNQDTSSVSVYRPDLMIDKSGFSCGADNTCGNGDDNATTAKIGETIEYTISYDNIGNMDAKNPVIDETIPVGSCYVSGSITPPPGATMDYFIDPTGTGTGPGIWVPDSVYVVTGGPDCTVRKFRVNFNASLPAPAHFDGEDALPEFSIQLVNTQAISTAGGDVIELAGDSLPTGLMLGSEPKIADFNLDTKPDILFPAVNASDKNKIYINNSTPSATVSLALGAQLSSPPATPALNREKIEVRDFNNDTKPDVIIMNGGLYAYRNTTTVPGSTPTFVLDVSQSIFDGTGSPANSFNYEVLANLDDDVNGKMDILMFGPYTSNACINTTPSAPGSIISFNCTTNGPGSTGGLGPNTSKQPGGSYVVADFNNDNLPDVMTGASGALGLKVSRNTTVGTTASFATDANVAVGGTYYRGLAYDFDSDGWMDVAIASPFRLYHNTTTVPGGPITFNGVTTGISGGHFMIGDVNGDIGADGEGQDIVFDYNGSPVIHGVGINNSTQGINPGTVDFNTILPFNNNFTSGAVPILHDFNGDGKNDILFAGYDTIGHAKVYRNTTAAPASPSFASDPGADLIGPIQQNPPCSNCLEDMPDSHQPTIADFDGDGKDDILINGGFGTTPAIFHNETSAGPSSPFIFTSYSGFTTFGQYNLASVTDFNNDGLLDIIFSDSFSNPLAVAYTNTSTPGSLSFTPSSTAYVSSGTYQTLINAPSVTAWDKFQVVQNTPAGTDIKYSFYDSTFTTQLLPPTSATNGYIDISGINPLGHSILGLHMDFVTTDTTETPTMDAWRATYRTPNKPSFTFHTVVMQNDISNPSVPVAVSFLNNVATISTSTPEINDNTANNTDNYIINLIHADVEIIKDVDFVAALAGDTLTYTLTYKNNGPNDAENVEIYDIWPFSSSTYMPYLTAPLSMNAANTSLGDPVACTFPAGDPYWGWDSVYCHGASGPLTLSPGESGTITVTAQVDPSVNPGDIITNVAKIYTTTLDSDLSNNQDDANTIIGSFANVYITKTAPASTNINADLPYTIHYGNNGNLPADNVVVTDLLDANVSYVPGSAIQTTGSPALLCGNFPSAMTITCNTTGNSSGTGVTLAPGATGTITLMVHVNNDTSLLINNSDIHNIATIVTTTPETNGADNTFALDVPVLPVGNASISGSVFFDSNGNVIRDMLDTPIQDVLVYLSGVDLYGNIYAPDCATSSSMYESLMAELVAKGLLSGGPYLCTLPTTYPPTFVPTAPNQTTILGAYSFPGLPMGTYIVTEEQPSSYVSTGSNAGYMNINALGNPVFNPATDGQGSVETLSSADVDHIFTIVLGDGQQAREYNFGETNGSIGDQIFLDSSGTAGVFDGSDVGIGNVTIALYTDVNNNGIIDAGEPVKTTTTSSSGIYQFANLALNKSYIVKVTDTNNITSSYNAVLGTVGTNNNGQNPNGYLVTLSSASPANSTADFGYSDPAGPCTSNCGTGSSTTGTTCTVDCNPPPVTGSIGNQVFFDINKDGIFQNGDAGIGGIAVTLYTDLNTNGIIDSGEPSLTQMTALGTGPSDPNTGVYQFIGLDVTKHYIVKITDTSVIANLNPTASMTSGAGNQDNYGKDPNGYVIASLSVTSTSDQTADFGYKTDETLPDTGRDNPLYVIIFGVIGIAAVAFITLKKFKVI